MKKGSSETTKKLVLCGMFTATAFVLGYVESLLPFSIGVPGVKLGLANIVSLFALYRIGTGSAFAILLARIILSAATFGNMNAFLYSLVGGLLSFAVMWLLKRSGKFSVMGVGIAGGVTHNTGQLLMASWMLGSALTAYLPVLMVAGAVAGVVVGGAAVMLVKRGKW